MFVQYLVQIMSVNDGGKERDKGVTSVSSCGTREKPTSVIEIYNIASKSKQEYPDLPSSLTCLFAFNVNNHNYYAGMISHDYYTQNVYEFHRLNLDDVTAGWEKFATMNEKKWSFAAAVFQGCIVVTGGFNGETHVSSTEVYDVQLNKWTDISFGSRRSQHNLVVAHGSLYLIGGRHGSIMASVQKLSELDGRGTAAQPMNTARCLFAAVNCNGFIYVIGGFTNHESKKSQHKRVKSVERYDPVKDEWIYVKELDHERWGYPAAWVLKGKIYLTGGCCEPESATKAIYCYDPTTDQWRVEGEMEYEVDGRSIVTL